MAHEGFFYIDESGAIREKYNLEWLASSQPA